MLLTKIISFTDERKFLFVFLINGFSRFFKIEIYSKHLLILFSNLNTNVRNVKIIGSPSISYKSVCRKNGQSVNFEVFLFPLKFYFEKNL